jgi:hypothetical protein
MGPKTCISTISVRPNVRAPAKASSELAKAVIPKKTKKKVPNISALTVFIFVSSNMVRTE